MDPTNLESEFGLLRRVVETSGRSLSFTVVQNLDYPDAWQDMLDLIGEANSEGLRGRGQVIGRPWLRASSPAAMAGR